MVWKLPSAAAITTPARKALAFLPAFPWYAWAGLGVGVAVLLAGGAAAAATAGGPGGAVPKPGGSPPLLKLGSTGDWVAYLQDRLLVPVTGTFDAATEAAVKGFQSANGLSPVDGIVGGQTWTTLGVAGAGGGGGGGGPPPPSQPPPKPPPDTPPAPPAPPTTGNPFGLSDTIPTRDGQILAHIADGNVEHQWTPLDYTTSDGHQVHVLVSRRALALADGTNRLIVDTTYKTAQKVADMIGGAMLTTRLSDEIKKHANKVVMTASSPAVPPSKNWSQDGTMSKTARMYEQSDYLEGRVAGAQGLVANEGKDWVITRHFWAPPQGLGPTSAGKSYHNSANFGWYYDPPMGNSKSPGGLSVVQSIGMTHDMAHTDYSQLLRFMKADSLTIDGTPWEYGAALADPNVSKYIQDEGGTIPLPRHPDL